MKEYHKINSIYKRDQTVRIGRTNPIIEGEWALPELEYLKDNLWELSEKIDGTNIRVHWNGSTIKFGGRTDNAQIPVKLYDALTSIFTIEKLSCQFGNKEITFYGEGIGEKIQDSGVYGLGYNFILFDANCGGYWLNRDAIEGIAKDLQLNVAPIVSSGISLVDAIDVVKCGLKSQYGDFIAEGVIARPIVPLFNRKGERIIVKIKGVDFK